MNNDTVYNCAYQLWKITMNMRGFGSYDQIDRAVCWHILTPFNHHTSTANLRKWIIQRFIKE